MAKALRNPQLVDALRDSTGIQKRWIEQFESSKVRMPAVIERESITSSVEGIVSSLQNLVTPGRDSIATPPLLTPGSGEMRELERAISFMAARLGATGFSCFDIGALILALRDVLLSHVDNNLYCEEHEEMKRYMDWLVVLATDSLATGNEQRAHEEWQHQLAEGTPLLMITSDLPAAIFVCQPGGQVTSGVLGRLLMTLVRTGGPATIVDVSGVTGGLTSSFADALQRFLSHPKISGAVTVFARGVAKNDKDSWTSRASESGTTLVFEERFDSCVSQCIALADG